MVQVDDTIRKATHGKSNPVDIYLGQQYPSVVMGCRKAVNNTNADEGYPITPH